MNDNYAVKFGLMAGGGTVIFLCLFYWIDKVLILQPGVIWSTLILYLLGMYMAPLEVRKSQDGIIDFKTALRNAFLVWVIANAIYHLFNYLLYNILDPEMLEVQRNYMLDNFDKIEGILSRDNIETLKEGTNQLNYSFFTVLTHYASSLIGGFLFAAVIARMIRREPISPQNQENATN